MAGGELKKPVQLSSAQKRNIIPPVMFITGGAEWVSAFILRFRHRSAELHLGRIRFPLLCR